MLHVDESTNFVHDATTPQRPHWLRSFGTRDRPRHSLNHTKQPLSNFVFCLPPTLLPQQLHNNPSQQNYDDLTDAVTRSASKKAEMMLLDIFVVALEFIKKVRSVLSALVFLDCAGCLPMS